MNAATSVKAVPVDSKANGGQVSDSGATLATNNKRKHIFLLAGIVAIAFVVIMVLVVRPAKEAEEFVPEYIDYSTGVSLVTFYGVESSIRGRLAQTKITMEVTNALDCSSIRAMAIQLPPSSRVASLETVSSETEDNKFCRTYGKVEEITQARDTFLEGASQGVPTAYIEEQEGSTYNLQVSLPPLGSTTVELVLEDLLLLRLGEVNFELPMSPIDAVDEITFDLDVKDVNQDPSMFKIDLSLALDVGNLGGELTNLLQQDDPDALMLPGNTTADGYRSAQFTLDLPDAQEYILPKIVRGSILPGEKPENGVVSTAGNCFEFYFQPNTLVPMRKNVVFAVDTAGARNGNSRTDAFEVVKQAIAQFIDTSMTPDDTFTIRTFGEEEGRERVYGPNLATDVEKVRADAFLSGLSQRTDEYSPNFHRGVLRGLLDSKDYAKDNGAGTVDILVIVSLHDYFVGEHRRKVIVNDILKLNYQADSTPIKIFSVGFDLVSDKKLLNTIAVLNGGQSTIIPIGGDLERAKSQLEFFFRSEFGTVYLSDVRIAFDGTSKPYAVTQSSFSMLADGFEVVSRGLLDADERAGPQSADFLKAVTSAMTTSGEMGWTALPTIVADESTEDDFANSYCFQSYAHSRISQLLVIADASELVDDDVLTDLINLVNPCETDKDTNLGDCIRQEALDLALKANVVVKGLTGMATVDDDSCQAFDPDAQICLDGSYADERFGDFAEDGDSRFFSSASSLGLTTAFSLLALCLFHQRE